jgi:hypothetical protein
LSATWSTNVPFNDSPVAPTIGYTSGFLYSTFAINYQWYYNGTLLTGDTIATYVPTQNGNYYVMVTGTNGCTAMSNVVNITGLGMSDLNNASIFSVKYFTQQKQIEVDINNFSGNESLEILNLLSQKVFEKTITSKTSMIDVSQLSNGTYILSFKSNAGTFVKKILVE